MDWLDVAAVPLRILLIIVVATLVVVVLRFVVGRVIKRLAAIPSAKLGRNARVNLGAPNPRRQQRLMTLKTILNSTVAALIAAVAIIMIVAELGVDVRPLLASAGVVGIALAFGAQSLVADILAGVFVLIEDQYSVGDRVEVAGAGPLATGTVLDVGLRITTLRDDDGRIWYVRNGQIVRVANESQGWALAIVDIRVAPADLPAAKEALAAVVEQLQQDSAYAPMMRTDAEPEFRVEDLLAAGITLRATLRTEAGQQWALAAELRTRVASEFGQREITLAE